MEIIFLLIMFFVLAWWFSAPKKNSNKGFTDKKELKLSQSTTDSALAFKNAMLQKSGSVRSGDFIPKEKPKASREEVHHFHHVEVKHTWERSTAEELKDHTEKVWDKLGYRVKSGETYSYKFYGREIFTPDQVEKIGNYRNRIARPGLSENQLKVKTIGLALVEKTGSKRAAKDILVEKYGLDEKTAKYAAGYRGYYDY